MEKNNRDLLENLRALKTNPNMIHDLNDEDLNNLFSLLEPKEETENIGENKSNKGMMLTKTNPIYKGEETRENNKFSNYRIDGFAAPLILAGITFIYGIIFMLIMSNY